MATAQTKAEAHDFTTPFKGRSDFWSGKGVCRFRESVL